METMIYIDIIGFLGICLCIYLLFYLKRDKLNMVKELYKLLCKNGLGNNLGICSFLIDMVGNKTITAKRYQSFTSFILDNYPDSNIYNLLGVKDRTGRAYFLHQIILRLERNG